MAEIYKNKNVKFFNTIDSELKAYILGYLLADGNISRSKDNRVSNVSIGQVIEDRYIVDLIHTNISPDTKLNRHRYKLKNGDINERITFKVSSKELTDDLIKLNVYSDKSHIDSNIPKIKDIYYKDLIRGFFDGDGTAGLYTYTTKRGVKKKYKNTKRVISFVSNSKLLLDDIRIILLDNDIVFKLYKEKTFYRLRCLTKSDINKFYNFIYINSEFYLQRKKSKIEELC